MYNLYVCMHTYAYTCAHSNTYIQTSYIFPCRSVSELLTHACTCIHAHTQEAQASENEGNVDSLILALKQFIPFTARAVDDSLIRLMAEKLIVRSVCLSVCLSVWMSVCVDVCVSVYVSMSLSVCLLFVCLSM